jgi:hypothetical protein
MLRTLLANKSSAVAAAEDYFFVLDSRRLGPPDLCLSRHFECWPQPNSISKCLESTYGGAE